MSNSRAHMGARTVQAIFDKIVDHNEHKEEIIRVFSSSLCSLCPLRLSSFKTIHHKVHKEHKGKSDQKMKI
jgi:hypothetical protein